MGLAAAISSLVACGPPDLPQIGPRMGSAAEAPREVVFPPVPALAPGQEPTLLHEYATRPAMTAAQWDTEVRTWVLPYKAKRLDAVLFIALAQGDMYALRQLLTPDAQWGLPDRRMLEAKPIFGDDGGQAFIDKLHAAALRFPEKAQWESTRVPDALAATFSTGAEPMWTHFAKINEGKSNDYIAIRKVVYRGQPRIDYVGFFADAPPEGPVQVNVGYGPPPPPAPPIDRQALIEMKAAAAGSEAPAGAPTRGPTAPGG